MPPRGNGCLHACGRIRSPAPDTMRAEMTGRPPLLAGQASSLRSLGYDEVWLQNWLAAAPERLGLGAVEIVAQELTQSRGGSLDILARDGDIYYSIEVQLGEVDASHSFRVFDYWANNRARYPGKTHIACLVAESAAGRFRPALEALAEYVPLIVIELRVWRGEAEAVVVPTTAVANESLDLAETTAVAGQARTEDDWRQEITDEAWRFSQDFVAWAQQNLGEVRVDFSPKSYIGVRRGRRVWAPLWPRTDGAYVYLPDPDGTRGPDASPAFERLSESLGDAGVEPSWQTHYNAGSNPVSVRLRRGDLAKPAVQELLRASFAILENGAETWSERNPIARASTAGEPFTETGDGPPDAEGTPEP